MERSAIRAQHRPALRCASCGLQSTIYRETPLNTQTLLKDADVSPVQRRFRDVVVDMRRDANGVIRLLAKEPLQPYPDRFHDHLWRWAKECPTRTFLAERQPGREGWASITYSETAERVGLIAQALAQRDLGSERPVLILSGNAIEHQAAGAGRHERRCAVRVDFGGLFADQPRPRQAALHHQIARSRLGLCSGRRALCARTHDSRNAGPRDRGRRAGVRGTQRNAIRRIAQGRLGRIPGTDKQPKSAPTRWRNSCSHRARPVPRRA